jgi:peptidoglycan LD-endopeptidase CwlK
MKQDKKTLERIKTAHPIIREELGNIYKEICQNVNGWVLCRFSHVIRTFAEQSALYAKGRTTAGPKVTNAPAGLSMHNYGLAVDIVLLRDKNKNGSFESASWNASADFDGDGVADWMEIVEIFKRYGWSWGGDWRSFKDLPHFQKSFGKKSSDLLKMHRDGKLDSAGYVELV